MRENLKPSENIRAEIADFPRGFEPFNGDGILVPEDNNASLFRDIFLRTDKDLQEYCNDYMFRIGYTREESIITKDYSYFKGNSPVLLVAHLDKVYPHPVDSLFINREDNYIIGALQDMPYQLGADDRAGVYAIMLILKKGFRPYVLFTLDEEVGELGALKAGHEIDSPDVRYMIEFDRANRLDCVFYNDQNQEFINYVEGFGFRSAEGSNTDIKQLAHLWNISGVNLSCGYYDAHKQFSDRLYLWKLIDNIQRVEEMLKKLPENTFRPEF